MSTTVTLPVLSSTVFLTGLLCVGLVFFIRAASKDRMQTVQFASDQSVAALQQQLIDYFEQRAYQRYGEAESSNWLKFRGWVRPSLFLAVFLSLLALVGLLCVALVVTFLFPQSGLLPLGLLVASPLAAIFYWRKAGREEHIAFRVLPLTEPGSAHQSQLTLQGHRDEVIQLTARLTLKPVE